MRSAAVMSLPCCWAASRIVGSTSDGIAPGTWQVERERQRWMLLWLRPIKRASGRAPNCRMTHAAGVNRMDLSSSAR